MIPTLKPCFKIDIIPLLKKELVTSKKNDLKNALEKLNPDCCSTGAKNQLIDELTRQLYQKIIQFKDKPDPIIQAKQYLRSWFQKQMRIFLPANKLQPYQDLLKRQFDGTDCPKYRTLKSNQNLIQNIWTDQIPVQYHCICPKGPSSLCQKKFSQICYKCGTSFHFDCLWGRSKDSKASDSFFQCPSCFLKNCLPHKKVQKVLFAGYLPTSKSNKLEFVVNFQIPPSIKNNPRINYQARCMRIKSQSQYNKYQITWPDNSTLLLNKKKVGEFKVLPSNTPLKRRSDQEIVFDKLSIYFDQYQSLVIEQKHEYDSGTNKYDYSSHFVMIVAVINQNQDELIKRYNGSRLTVSQSKQILKNYLGVNKSNDVQLQKLSISLKCPMFFTKITIPVRSKHCTTHFQPFDLNNFIKISRTVGKGSAQKYKCPICKRRAYDLFVDQYLLQLMNQKSHGQNICEITFRADGQPHFQQEDISLDVDSQEQNIPKNNSLEGDDLNQKQGGMNKDKVQNKITKPCDKDESQCQMIDLDDQQLNFNQKIVSKEQLRQSIQLSNKQKKHKIGQNTQNQNPFANNSKSLSLKRSKQVSYHNQAQLLKNKKKPNNIQQQNNNNNSNNEPYISSQMDKIRKKNKLSDPSCNEQALQIFQYKNNKALSNNDNQQNKTIGNNVHNNAHQKKNTSTDLNKNTNFSSSDKNKIIPTVEASNCKNSKLSDTNKYIQQQHSQINRTLDSLKNKHKQNQQGIRKINYENIPKKPLSFLQKPSQTIQAISQSKKAVQPQKMNRNHNSFQKASIQRPKKPVLLQSSLQAITKHINEAHRHNEHRSSKQKIDSAKNHLLLKQRLIEIATQKQKHRKNQQISNQKSILLEKNSQQQQKPSQNPIQNKILNEQSQCTKYKPLTNSIQSHDQQKQVCKQKQAYELQRQINAHQQYQNQQFQLNEQQLSCSQQYQQGDQQYDDQQQQNEQQQLNKQLQKPYQQQVRIIQISSDQQEQKCLQYLPSTIRENQRSKIISQQKQKRKAQINVVKPKYPFNNANRQKNYSNNNHNTQNNNNSNGKNVQGHNNQNNVQSHNNNVQSDNNKLKSDNKKIKINKIVIPSKSKAQKQANKLNGQKTSNINSQKFLPQNNKPFQDQQQDSNQQIYQQDQSYSNDQIDQPQHDDQDSQYSLYQQLNDDQIQINKNAQQPIDLQNNQPTNNNIQPAGKNKNNYDNIQGNGKRLHSESYITAKLKKKPKFDQQRNQNQQNQDLQNNQNNVTFYSSASNDKKSSNDKKVSNDKKKGQQPCRNQKQTKFSTKINQSINRKSIFIQLQNSEDQMNQPQEQIVIQNSMNQYNELQIITPQTKQDLYLKELRQLREQIQAKRKHFSDRVVKQYKVEAINDKDENIFWNLLQELNQANDFLIFS